MNFIRHCDKGPYRERLDQGTDQDGGTGRKKQSKTKTRSERKHFCRIITGVIFKKYLLILVNIYMTSFMDIQNGLL